MKLIAAAALAVAFAAPASAFDNADCKAFLTGSWTLETEQDMGGTKAKIEAHSTYSADGTFTQTMTMTAEGAPPQSLAREGNWDAGPGSKPDTCLARLTPKGEPESALELTVVDGDTVATPDGLQSKRATD
ncbi:MAG: hypothetical protein QM698_10235 [Micropepsaceae bacterium]